MVMRQWLSRFQQIWLNSSKLQLSKHADFAGTFEGLHCQAEFVGGELYCRNQAAGRTCDHGMSPGTGCDRAARGMKRRFRAGRVLCTGAWLCDATPCARAAKTLPVKAWALACWRGGQSGNCAQHPVGSCAQACHAKWAPSCAQVRATHLGELDLGGALWLTEGEARGRRRGAGCWGGRRPSSWVLRCWAGSCSGLLQWVAAPHHPWARFQTIGLRLAAKQRLPVLVPAARQQPLPGWLVGGGRPTAPPR